MRLFKSQTAAAVLLSLALFGCAREGDIIQTGILTTYTACPPVRDPGAGGRLTCSTRPAAATPTRSTSSPTSPTCAAPATRPANISSPGNLRGQRPAPRQSRRPRGRAALFRRRRSGRRQCRRQARSRVGLRFEDGHTGPAPPAPPPRRCCARRPPCPRTSAARSPASAAPATRRRRRPDGRSGGARRGRAGPLRGARRLRAEPGPAPLQRHALSLIAQGRVN